MTSPEQFDFLRYMDDNSIEYVTQAGNLSKGWLAAISCGFCGEHNHKLGIGPTGTYGNCWSCGHKSLYTLTKHLTPNLHYEDLIEQYSDYVDRRKTWGKKVAKATELEFNFNPLGKVARKYLVGRGFDPDYLQEKYNLRDGGLVGDWRFRIIIPIYHNGILVSWQGRSIIKDAEVRYLTLGIEKSVMDAKSVFFNWDNATGDTVIVNEGPFDSMRLGDGAIATLGTSTTEAQVRLLTKFKKVIVLFDPEKAAMVRAHKFANKVAALGINVEVIDTEADDDVGSMSQEEADKLKKELLN